MTLLNMSFGIIAGCLGGFNITLTKSMFAVMGGQYREEGISGLMLSPLCWGLGITLLFTFVFQLVCVTDGLEKCAALVVVPVQSVTEELTATLGGLLYFQDYTQFTFTSACVFALGDLIAIVSVITMVALRIGDELRHPSIHPNQGIDDFKNRHPGYGDQDPLLKEDSL